MVKLGDLLMAFEFVSAGAPGENEAYMCVVTGAFHCRSAYADQEEELPDDINDPERCVALLHKNDLGLGNRLALRFVEAALPGRTHDVR